MKRRSRLCSVLAFALFVPGLAPAEGAERVEGPMGRAVDALLRRYEGEAFSVRLVLR